MFKGFLFCVATFSSVFSVDGVFASETPGVIFEEDFEDGALDTRLSINTFNESWPLPDPGIKNTTVFGSTRAFGFGTSGCMMDCFTNLTQLTITFDPPQVVTSLVFKEME